MPEPFKNLISVASIEAHAARVGAVEPSFDGASFVAAATQGLDALELKARVAHVAEALRAHLPPHWPEALAILVAALPAALPDTEEVSSQMTLWPFLHVVEVHGLEHPHASLAALRQLTKRFSAEFAIRPYVRAHPELTWEHVHAWCRDDDVHVRRLCSEGTRPRLPWGGVLRESVADPGRGLDVIERLVDDPEPFVRTSVANHLNDVSKDHPAQAVATARRWLETETEGRAWIVRRALRTLVKKGDPEALAALGFTPPRATLHGLTITPGEVAIGGRAELAAELTAGASQGWMVDWIVRAPRADGSLGHRVVKGSQLRVTNGERATVTGRLSLRPVTTRVTRPGTWRVAVQVNGEVLGEASVEVTGDAR